MKKIAVLVSKEDRCLRQLIADSKQGSLRGTISCVLSNHTDLQSVIEQDVFRIDVGKDSLEEVKRKGLELEAQVLSRAVRMFVDNQLQIAGGKVLLKPGAS